MLPGLLRLRVGFDEVEEYDDVEEDELLPPVLSNLLRMSLCAPEADTRRTTGRRPVVRSGMIGGGGYGALSRIRTR